MEPSDYVAATGIGVSDLEASACFYEAALGMRRVGAITLPHLDEIILTHHGRNALVLMHWKDGSVPTYNNLPVMLGFLVDDPQAVTDRIRCAGGTVTREPAQMDDFGVIGLARDPDGYVIELMQTPPPRGLVL